MRPSAIVIPLLLVGCGPPGSATVSPAPNLAFTDQQRTPCAWAPSQLGAPQTFRVPMPRTTSAEGDSIAQCFGPPLTDGLGDVAVRVDPENYEERDAWIALDPDGGALASFSAQVGAPLWSEPNGYLRLGAFGDGPHLPDEVVWANHPRTGALGAATIPAGVYPLTNVHVAPIPGGGGAITYVRDAPTSTGDTEIQYLDLYDADAALTWRAVLASETHYGAVAPVLALGVDTNATALVLSQADAGAVGTWVDASGIVGTVSLGFVAALNDPELLPLPGGGLALRSARTAVASLSPGQAVASAPPAWLAAWDGWDLQLLDGRGYVARAPGDGRAWALVDLDGETCGQFTPEQVQATAGVRFDGDFGVGGDGSLSTAHDEATDGGVDCVIDVWRGALE